jgi:PTS system mannose-specific IID component
MSSADKSKKLRPGTIFSVFIRSLLLQGLWNFQGMQNMGFLLAIDPALRELYSGEELSQARRRHSTFFNTHPYMANAVLGASVYYESRGQPEDAVKVKAQFIGPLGAMGDNLFWNGIRPLAIGIALCFGGLAPWVFLLLYNLMHLPARYGLLRSGWNRGSAVVSDMNRFQPSRLITLTRYLCLFFLGAALVLISWDNNLIQGVVVLFFAAAAFIISKYRFPNHLIWLAGLVIMIGLSYGFGDLYNL